MWSNQKIMWLDKDKTKKIRGRIKMGSVSEVPSLQNRAKTLTAIV